jgi:hypothetical protein
MGCRRNQICDTLPWKKAACVNDLLRSVRPVLPWYGCGPIDAIWNHSAKTRPAVKALEALQSRGRIGDNRARSCYDNLLFGTPLRPFGHRRSVPENFVSLIHDARVWITLKQPRCQLQVTHE